MRDRIFVGRRGPRPVDAEWRFESEELENASFVVHEWNEATLDQHDGWSAVRRRVRPVSSNAARE
jgi:hypothetical protein